jgi:hypothetical protein
MPVVNLECNLPVNRFLKHGCAGRFDQRDLAGFCFISTDPGWDFVMKYFLLIMDTNIQPVIGASAGAVS